MMRRDLQLLAAAAVTSFLLQPAIGLGAEPPAAATIVGKMAGVTDELNRKETGKPVQTEQKTIVSDLDELIASLEKQCEKCRGNMSRNNPNKGMDDSRIKSGTGGIGALVDPTGKGNDWGKLSARERDRIMQSMTEGFPPEYRTVLERYYRRLADDKKVAPAADSSAEGKDKAVGAAKEAGK
jgi:hypothetical protein